MQPELDGVIPPGWYRDPNGSGGRRWWNGLAWTNAVDDGTTPLGLASAAVRQPFLSSSVVLNPWPVWGIAVAPLVSLVQLVLIDWPASVRAAMAAAQAGSTAQYVAPGFVLVELVGLLVFALTVAFAAIDWYLLRARGVVRPFFWAWVLLSPIVYLIGRAVVLHRRTKRSARGPVWAWVLAEIVAVVVPAVYLSSVIAQVVSEMLARSGALV